MKKQGLWVWVAANAFGFGVSFIAMLQMTMLVEYGFEFEKHWQFVPPGDGPRAYIARLVAAMLGGLILGGAQALVLRNRGVRTRSWIFATVAGFALLTVATWPLMAMEIWGRIPGPAEPIIIAVGGGSLAGIMQYLAMRRQANVTSRWLALWVVGLVVGLVPTALLFMTLEGMGLALSWPVEGFLSGFPIAGVAALISGIPGDVFQNRVSGTRLPQRQFHNPLPGE